MPFCCYYWGLFCLSLYFVANLRSAVTFNYWWSPRDLWTKQVSVITPACPWPWPCHGSLTSSHSALFCWLEVRVETEIRWALWGSPGSNTICQWQLPVTKRSIWQYPAAQQRTDQNLVQHHNFHPIVQGTVSCHCRSYCQPMYEVTCCSYLRARDHVYGR